MMKNNFFIAIFIIVFGFISLIIGINNPFVLVLLEVLICYLLSFKFNFNLKGFPIILFLISFFIRLGYILIVNTPVESDFKLLFDAGVSFSNGDYSFSFAKYFSEWAYQTGFVIYEGTIIKLFGYANSILVLKILNAVFSSLTIVLIYFILKSFVSERVSRLSALFGSFLIFPLMHVTVLSNHQLATFFIFIGLFFITENNLTLKGWVRALLSGMFIAFGNIMRPEGIIVIVSIGLFFLIRIINPREEKRKDIITKAALLLAVYYGINILASQLIISTGVNPQGLKNNNPLFKFVIGLNYETNGLYSQKDVDIIYGQDLSHDERKTIELELIEERLKKGPIKLSALFIKKQYILWGGNPLVWSYSSLINSNAEFGSIKISEIVKSAGQLLYRCHSFQMFML